MSASGPVTDQDRAAAAGAKSGGSRTWIIVIVAIVIVLALVGVAYGEGWILKPATKPGCPSPTSVLGAGSTFVLPLMQTWESAYYSGKVVNYQGVGSGAGIQQITAHTVDFGATDAPLNATQTAAAPGILTFPDAAGAVAVIYNLPGIAAPISLNGAVLASIYLGSVKFWNDPSITALNPGVTFPSNAIVVVHRSDGSGTTFIWSSYLSAESSQWATSPGKGTSLNWPAGVGAKGSGGVATTVQTTADSIGYVDLEYALANGIQFAKVANPQGKFILPTIADTASALADTSITPPSGSGSWYNVSFLNAPGVGDYPIVSITYLLVYQQPDKAFGSTYTLQKAENVVDFLHWILTTGQSYSAGLYYVPLPESLVATDTTTLNTISFGGNSVPIANC